MHRSRAYFIYILTNKFNRVLYTGVTNSLSNRVEQHRSGVARKSFTRRYNVHKLVYYEDYGDIHDALAREKQIKSWSHRRKVALIDSVNPDWRDVGEDLY